MIPSRQVLEEAMPLDGVEVRTVVA
jgi:hypothetical protein